MLDKETIESLTYINYLLHNENLSFRSVLSVLLPLYCSFQSQQ